MNWIDVKEKLPGNSCIVSIKRQNGEESTAYFHLDKMAWLMFYTKHKLSHFQEKKTLEFLDDVTHWKILKSKD